MVAVRKYISPLVVVMVMGTTTVVVHGSALGTWGDIAAIVAGALTLGAALIGGTAWIRGKLFAPYRIDFPTKELEASRGPKDCVLHVGDEVDVFIRIRVRIAREIEIRDFMVRPAEHLRRRWLNHLVSGKLQWDPPPAETVTFMGLADAEAEYDQRVTAPNLVPAHQFRDRRQDEVRGTRIGTFSPAYPRSKGEPINIRLRIRAEQPWNGRMLLRLPNGNGETIHVYPHLRILP